MKKNVKTRRICAGEYETTNTVPIARVSKSMDGDGTWNVSWGKYDGSFILIFFYFFVDKSFWIW